MWGLYGAALLAKVRYLRAGAVCPATNLCCIVMLSGYFQARNAGSIPATRSSLQNTANRGLLQEASGEDCGSSMGPKALRGMPLQHTPDGCVLIPLTKDQWAVVDADDLAAIGSFGTEMEAAVARDRAAVEAWGAAAFLNVGGVA